MTPTPHPADGPRPGHGLRGVRLDSDVAGILTGPLSRGVAGAERREALARWEDHARARWKATGDPWFAQFLGGMAAARVALYGRHVDADRPEDPHGALTGFITDGTVPDAVLRGADIQLGRKRPDAAARERWRMLLPCAPSPAAHHGLLVAAAALSGLDAAWGLDRDRDQVILRGWSD